MIALLVNPTAFMAFVFCYVLAWCTVLFFQNYIVMAVVRYVSGTMVLDLFDAAWMDA